MLSRRFRFASACTFRSAFGAEAMRNAPACSDFSIAMRRFNSATRTAGENCRADQELVSMANSSSVTSEAKTARPAPAAAAAAGAAEAPTNASKSLVGLELAAWTRRKSSVRMCSVRLWACARIFLCRQDAGADGIRQIRGLSGPALRATEGYSAKETKIRR